MCNDHLIYVTLEMRSKKSSIFYGTYFKLNNDFHVIAAKSRVDSLIRNHIDNLILNLGHLL